MRHKQNNRAEQTMGKNGRSVQNKGKQGERDVIALLQPVVNQIYAEFQEQPPRLQRDTRQADGGGSDISGLDWAAIEVKRDERMSVDAMWAQTVRQAGMRRVPILFYRKNGHPWRVVMFGLLGTPSAGRTCRVTVELADFMAWFRIKLVEELS